jgi:hypothetical protein
MTQIVGALVTLAVMTVFVAGSLRYFRRIRAHRADPVIDPSWPTIMRPSNPPPADPNDQLRRA